ncbi:MAG TPA: hydantoin racemase [Firmicutes bacterium]|nr:hydantoin racemase [Bacillota bacterium]
MTSRRILYIEPTRHDPVKQERLATYLRKYAAPGTELSVVGLEQGTAHLEYHAYAAASLPEILCKIQDAEQSGFDAAIIGCFYDPGLREAREVAVRMPVTAPAESALHLAALLGHRFSILVGRRKWIPAMEENVRRYGFADRLASFRPIGMGVLDFRRDPEETGRRLLSAARSAIEEDGAEVIILGCTMQLGFFQQLQESLGVPVIDVAVAALKHAEMLSEVRAWGWTPSKIGGYETPPEHELACWGLRNQAKE